MLAIALVLSVVGLLVGPALVAVGRGRALPTAAIEGLTLGAVPTLIAVRLVPHVCHEIGGWGLALLASGYVALWAAEHRGRRAGVAMGQVVVVPALVLHALSDGAGLAVAAAASARGAGVAAAGMLGAALLLHRLPEGFFLANALLPEIGWRRMFSRVALVAAATIVGGLGGEALLARIPEAALDGVVAVGLGAMLRLVVHAHGARARTSIERALSGATFVLGLVGALAVPTPDSVLARAQPSELSVAQSLGPLFVETAPYVLAGLLVTGLLQSIAPRRPEGWLGAQGQLVRQAARGVVLGLPRLACVCGVLPLSRALLKGGAPSAAVGAFAVGAAALGPETFLVSVRLLGFELSVWRALATAVVAVAAGVVVGCVAPRFRFAPRSTRRTGLLTAPAVRRIADPSGRGSTFTARARAGLAYAFGPALDHTAAWYLVGLVVAAAVEAAVDPAAVRRLGAPGDVLLSALVATPFRLCAHGITPVAAVLIHKGVSPGAAIAMLVAGPACDPRLIGLFRDALGRRASAAFGLMVVGGATLCGVLANALLGQHASPEMHPMLLDRHHGAAWICAIAVAALLLSSLLRLGPRTWFRSMAADVSSRPR